MVVATLTLRLRQSSLSAPSLFMGGVGSSFEWPWESKSKSELKRAAEQARLGEAQRNRAAELARSDMARLDAADELARLVEVRRKRAAEFARVDEAAEKDRQKEAATKATLLYLKGRPTIDLPTEFPDLLGENPRELRKEFKKTLSPIEANVSAQYLLATVNEFLIVELAPFLTADDAFAYAKYFAAMGLSGQSERYIVGFLSARLTSEQALDVAIKVMDSPWDIAKYGFVIDKELELQKIEYQTKASILTSLKNRMNDADTLTFSGSASGLPRERAI